MGVQTTLGENLAACVRWHDETRGTWPARDPHSEARWIAQELGLGEGSSVLELGAGSGATLAALAELGMRVAGVELSADACALAAERGVELERADARALEGPPGGDAFDATVLLPGLLGVGVTDDDRARGAAAARATREGGRILLAAPHVATAHSAEGFDLLSCRRPIGADEHRWTQRSFQRTELAARLREASVGVDSVRRGPLGVPQTQASHESVVVTGTVGAPLRDAADETPRGWYGDFFEGMGAEYLEYGFTRGTVHETRDLVRELELGPSARVLDVGCGPGRHAIELARRGFEVVGVDLSPSLIEAARERAGAAGVEVSFEVMDAREIPPTGDFDAAYCVCEGAFGLLEDDLENQRILHAIRGALHEGGRFFLTTLSLLRMLKQGVQIDLDTGVESWTQAPEHAPENPLRCANRGYLFPEVVDLVRAAGFEAEVPESNFCFGRSVLTPQNFELRLLSRAVARPEEH